MRWFASWVSTRKLVLTKAVTATRLQGGFQHVAKGVVELPSDAEERSPSSFGHSRDNLLPPVTAPIFREVPAGPLGHLRQMNTPPHYHSTTLHRHVHCAPSAAITSAPSACSNCTLSSSTKSSRCGQSHAGTLVLSMLSTHCTVYTL